jgi:hypothetical protein
MVEDTRRGLFSYDALRTRLQESRYAARAGLRDVSGPVIKLEPLSFEEVFVLLQRLRHLHAMYHGYPERVTDQELKEFMEETLNRLGADRFATPREIIRDLISVLNLVQQNPELSFDKLVHGAEFKPSARAPDREMVDSEDVEVSAPTIPSTSGPSVSEATTTGEAPSGVSIDNKFRGFTL